MSLAVVPTPSEPPRRSGSRKTTRRDGKPLRWVARANRARERFDHDLGLATTPNQRVAAASDYLRLLLADRSVDPQAATAAADQVVRFVQDLAADFIANAPRKATS